MKALKYTMTIKVEVLSIDAIPGIISEAMAQLDKEFKDGKLVADDGDMVEWTTEQESVEF